MRLHPDLLNNSLFLRYYEQWQRDPSSVVFAAIADFFLRYGMLDEALKICREGLKHHPQLVSGRVVLAKIHLLRGNWEESEEEVQRILLQHPRNVQALQLRERLEQERSSEQPPAKIETTPPVRETGSVALARTIVPLPLASEESETLPDDVPQGWRTITMAQIFAMQGHHDRARRIYRAILTTDPGNEAARRGLQSLGSMNAASAV